MNQQNILPKAAVQEHQKRISSLVQLHKSSLNEIQANTQSIVNQLIAQLEINKFSEQIQTIIDDCLYYTDQYYYFQLSKLTDSQIREGKQCKSLLDSLVSKYGHFGYFPESASQIQKFLQRLKSYLISQENNQLSEFTKAWKYDNNLLQNLFLCEDLQHKIELIDANYQTFEHRLQSFSVLSSQMNEIDPNFTQHLKKLQQLMKSSINYFVSDLIPQLELLYNRQQNAFQQYSDSLGNHNIRELCQMNKEFCVFQETVLQLDNLVSKNESALSVLKLNNDNQLFLDLKQNRYSAVYFLFRSFSIDFQSQITIKLLDSISQHLQIEELFALFLAEKSQFNSDIEALVKETEDLLGDQKYLYYQQLAENFDTAKLQLSEELQVSRDDIEAKIDKIIQFIESTSTDFFTIPQRYLLPTITRKNDYQEDQISKLFELLENETEVIDCFDQFDKDYTNVLKFNDVQNYCCCFGKEVNYLLRKLEIKFKTQFILKDFVPQYQNIESLKWEKLNDIEQHEKNALLADIGDQILKLDQLLINQFESLCIDFEIVIASYGSLSHFDIMQMTTALTKPITFNYDLTLNFRDRNYVISDIIPEKQRILRHILKLDIKKFRNIYDVPLVLVIPANLLLVERENHKSKFDEFQDSQAILQYSNDTISVILKISCDFHELQMLNESGDELLFRVDIEQIQKSKLSLKNLLLQRSADVYQLDLLFKDQQINLYFIIKLIQKFSASTVQQYFDQEV